MVEGTQIEHSAVRFWLGNKQVYGRPTATIDNEQLVLYHGKYYLLCGGSPRFKRGRPVYYTESSMPAFWRRSIAGQLEQPAKHEENRDTPPSPATTAPIIRSETDSKENSMSTEEHAASVPDKQPARKTRSQPRKRRAPEDMNGIDVSCPYCAHLERFPQESATGKPVIHTCGGCRADYGMRITAVTTFQVETAAFGK